VKRDIILLPSLLLASGFECLQTQDIKFLNNYRKHFDKTKHNLEEIFIITESDYELGGIMNPFNKFHPDQIIYDQVRQGIQTFPYVTRIDLNRIVYAKKVKELTKQITKEITSELRKNLETNTGIQMAIRNREFCSSSIDNLKTLPVYQKVCSLHMCGYGLKLIDGFNHFLELYLKRYKK